MWDLVLINDERLITGCHDNQLRVFKIEFKDDETEAGANDAAIGKKIKIDDDDEDDIDEENVRFGLIFLKQLV